MSREMRSMQERADEIHVDLWMAGATAEYLPPRLWEELRIRMQTLYRQATGEEFATLIVEND